MWAETLFLPSRGWRKLSAQKLSDSEVFWNVMFPLALAAPFTHYLWIILSGSFPGPLIGLVASVFIFGLNLAIVFVFASIIVSLSDAMQGSSSKESALALSAVSMAPWHLALALFPLIGGAAFFGLAWAVILYISGIRIFEPVPRERQLRFTMSSLLCFGATLLLANLLLMGILSIIFSSMGIVGGPPPA